MRIAMIGDSNAGKTTYMAMMYRAMSKGFEGFRLATVNLRYGKDLLDAAEDIRKDRYPPPTAQRALYNFNLSQNNQTFFEFAWSDYRGGALSDRQSESDVKELHSDLQSADGIMVFADAMRFASEPNIHRHARRLTAACEWAIANQTRKVPVVVVYTKADLIKGDDAWARAVAPLAELQGILDASPLIHSLSVRVSCGRRPRNAHIPVLWCLSRHILERITELESRRDNYQYLAERARANSSLRNSWESWRNGTTSEAKRARQHEASAQEMVSQLLPLREPALALDKLIQKHLDRQGDKGFLRRVMPWQ